MREYHFWLNKNGLSSHHNPNPQWLSVKAAWVDCVVHWRHLLSAELSQADEDGHHLEEGCFIGCLTQSSDGNISTIQHASFSSTWAWYLQNYALEHAFAGVRSEAQSTVVLPGLSAYHTWIIIALNVLSTIIAFAIRVQKKKKLLFPRIFFAIRVQCMFFAIRDWINTKQ